MVARPLGEFLAGHPRLVDALFTVMLLWAQHGGIVPHGGGGGNAGP